MSVNLRGLEFFPLVLDIMVSIFEFLKVLLIVSVSLLSAQPTHEGNSLLELQIIV